MTDRQPDPLFDALRTRLADYGQEPPAPLWAGIRAQLPAAAARPWRRRRWAPALLLGLLLAVLGGAGWFWRRTAPATSVATTLLGPASRRAGAELNEHATHEPRVPTETYASRRAVQPQANPTITISTQRAVKSIKLPQMAAAELPFSEAMPLARAPSAATTPTARSGRGAFAGRGRGAASAASARRRTRAGVEFETALGAAAIHSRRTRRTNGTLAARGFDAASREPRFGSRAAFDNRGAAAAGQAGELASGAASKAAPTEGSSARTQSTAFPVSTGEAGSGSESTGQLAALMARVSTQLQPLPTLQAAPEAPRLSPAQVPRRWALEVLAGPALTYRRLGAAARPDYPVPSSSSPTTNFYTRTGTTTSVTEQELPTGSFGAQVQVRRVLTGRWSVSTGLGYQEYATRLNLRTVPATIRTISPTGVLGLNVADSAKVSAVRLRDTYRFLTVPVRASYRLGAGGRHLGLGLLAGADVAWYLGGASAEGSACGCTSQALDRTGSPYRPLSLALSLGLDLRYRLGPRWELLAQPTASYFLNSLARPTAGFVPRYLLGGSALLGISYGLR